MFILNSRQFDYLNTIKYFNNSIILKWMNITELLKKMHWSIRYQKIKGLLCQTLGYVMMAKISIFFLMWFYFAFSCLEYIFLISYI